MKNVKQTNNAQKNLLQFVLLPQRTIISFCHKSIIHIFINLLLTSIFESQAPDPKKAQAKQRLDIRTHHMKATIVGLEAGQA